MQDGERESDKIEQRFGERVREMRTAASLSQAALAEGLARHGGPRLDPSGIARLERGQKRVALGEAVILSRMLGASVDALIGSEPLPDPPPQVAADVAAVERELTGTLERVRGLGSRLKRARRMSDEEIEHAGAEAAAWAAIGIDSDGRHVRGVTDEQAAEFVERRRAAGEHPERDFHGLLRDDYES